MTENVHIFKLTILIYAAIFGGATALTLAFRKVNWGRNMRTAILSWLVIFVMFLCAAYAGHLAFMCLITAISTLAVNEYYRMAGIRSIPVRILSLLLVGAAACFAFFDTKIFFYAIPGICVMIFYACHTAFSSFDDINKTVGVATAGFIYWGWLPFHFVFLHQLDHGFGYIVILCTMIAFNDNSAYYVGKLLGKRSKKFSPKISPNKTWAGTIGGFIGTILIAVAFRYALPHFSIPVIMMLAVVVALSIPVGDLIESAMKRDLKVKDSGVLIPGHGGVLDRFDSWIFATPLMYYFLLFFLHIRS